MSTTILQDPAAPETPDVAPQPRRIDRTRLAPLLVAVAAAAPFLASIGYGFVYDDGDIIAGNAALHTPFGILNALRVPYWPRSFGPAGLYRPLMQSLYALLWKLGSGAAWPFHLTTVALHVCCALAVLWLLRRALPEWAALLGALCFAVHPVHVEAVANIVGSAEIVAALLMLAFVSLLWRVLAQDAMVDWATAVKLAAIYALALGAKESAATVPALALVGVWGWRASSAGDAARRPAAAMLGLARGAWRVWLACAVALAAMTLARYAVLGALAPPESALAPGVQGVSASQRIWTMVAAWPLVAKLLFWPAQLSMHYGPTTILPYDGPSSAARLSLAIVALATVISIALARRGDRRPLAALLWVALSYLAASNLLVPTGQLLAERTLYLPSLGAVMLAMWAFVRIAELATADGLARAVPVAVCIGGALVILGSARSAVRTPVWRSGEALFESGIEADSQAFYPYQQLARWYGRHGDDARGIEYLGKAYERDPGREGLALEYAQHLRSSGRAEEALAIVRATSRAHSSSQPARVAFLDLLMQLRGPDSVIVDVRTHPAPDPAGVLRYIFLARALASEGHTDSVPAVYRRAVAEAPSDASMRFQLALALHAAGVQREAKMQLGIAAKIGGIPPVATHSLASTIALAIGDSVEARHELDLALAAAPRDSALARLDSTLAAHGR